MPGGRCAKTGKSVCRCTPGSIGIVHGGFQPFDGQVSKGSAKSVAPGVASHLQPVDLLNPDSFKRMAGRGFKGRSKSFNR